MRLLDFLKRMKKSGEDKIDPMEEQKHIPDDETASEYESAIDGDKTDTLGENTEKTEYKKPKVTTPDKVYIPLDQPDALYNRAIDIVCRTQMASVSMLQRRLYLGYGSAARLVDRMEKDGIIGPFNGSTPRKVLVSDADEAKLLIKEEPVEEEPIKKEPASIPSDYKQKEKLDFGSIDSMEGHEFEYWCSDLLKRNGFSSVEVTKGSGDQGVDIVATKDGVRYAIQCKRYLSPLGNKPVQEVHAGKTIYKCHVGVVMTNSYFTPGAKELAEATGVLLWDRDTLQAMMADAAKMGKQL